MSAEKSVYEGGCMCGAVRYRVAGELDDPHLCHCGMCQRQSGHCVAGAAAARADLEITGNESVTWFQSSSFARRGFCKVCGSKLFWDDGSEWVGLNMGSLDQPTGLTLERHIFVEDKPDYYEITDPLPQYEGVDTLRPPASGAGSD
ncbi:MAG: GFA family protein [Pseudomonadota bacterium]